MSNEQSVNIKQRIIGAIVLVSLGVIIIPLLLNGGTNLKQGISRTNIPPKPKVLNKELAAVPAAKKMPAAKIISSRPVYNSSSQQEKMSQQRKTAAKMSIDNQYKRLKEPVSSEIKIAYTLQVASFRQKNNAITLRDKLRKKGFKAYSEYIQTSKGKVYRLRVGPYLNYDQIVSDKKKIEKKFKPGNTVIVKHET
ncbi:MAG: SPOR domain-containing protein [gamma proteobacterium symbiont of Taylorina sp.]|nr:SPOR domain-containing protein [gamma proteobacterium symbiont of Taylorina sp.]